MGLETQTSPAPYVKSLRRAQPVVVQVVVLDARW